MRARLALPLALIVSSAVIECGQLASDADGSDGPVLDASMDVHCVQGAFGALTPVAELNTTADERGLRLSPDELFGVFSRVTASDASLPPLSLYAASRADAQSAFAQSKIMYLASDGWQYPAVYPTLTSNGSMLTYESLCQGQTVPHASTLCAARRDASTNGFFGIDPLIGTVSDTDTIPGGFGAGFALGDGFVNGDASAYYFVSRLAPDGGLAATDGGSSPQAIFVTHAAAGIFNSYALVARDDASWMDNPVLSADELTMYVSTRASYSASPHVAVMTRSDAQAPFGPPVQLHELDSTDGEYPTWVSPDQCRLYLTRVVDGHGDLFVASRAP